MVKRFVHDGNLLDLDKDQNLTRVSWNEINRFDVQYQSTVITFFW